jgi:hypothetical protein
MLTRRQFLLASAAAVAGRRLFAAAPPRPRTAPFVITVYKDPSCGCCKKWVKHLTASGFVVMPHDVENIDEIKRTMNVPKALQACHTAIVGHYIVEGHVPADVIKKLVAEKPAVLGIAVPGMPTGSPGMEVEGEPAEHYNVVAFDRNGATRVYAKR